MSCNEWKEYRLEDISQIIFSGGTPSTRNEEFWDGDIPWLSSGETRNSFINKTEKTITEEGVKNSSTKLALNGDIVIASAGQGFTRGQVSFCNIDTYINQSLIAIRANNILLNNKYLYYNLKSRYNELRQISDSHSIRGSLTTKMIKDLIIKLPSLEEQEKIANILSSLDDKIELNNEMNKTLEEMAQSIFKRWFVDFEFPTEDGEPYKSSGGEIVDSELGMIPKGWEVKCLGDIGNVITGKTPSAKIEGSYGDECNFITPRDITNSPIIIDTERKLSSIGINNLKKNLVCKNSIGVSCIGSNLGEVYITGENSITNQQINTVVLDESHIYPYIYIYLKNMKNEFLNMAGGSAVPIINKTSFSGINILMPDMYILNKFVQSTTCYFERIEENLKENESLIALRDNLLPKLMSGEIDLSK